MRLPRFAALPLTLMLVGAALLAVLVLRASAEQRTQQERRFDDRARITANLTGSALAATGRQIAQLSAERLGGERVSREQLGGIVTGTEALYALVLDDRGRRIAGTPGAPARPGGSTAPGMPLRLVLDGRPAGWSETLRLDGVPAHESYARLRTRNGMRVLVRAFPTSQYASFLDSTLSTLPSVITGDIIVSDADGARAVAGFEDGRRVEGRIADPSLRTAIAGRARAGDLPNGLRYATAVIPGSDWEVLIAEPRSALGDGGGVQWILFAVLLALGLAAAVLTVRIAQAKARLRGAFDRLELVSAEQHRANVELERSNAELEQFASVASHDLQEPLRKVQAFGDQIEHRFGDDVPDEAKDYLRRMRAASARMSVLIEDLLRFSRVTTHARPPEDVDLGRVAHEVLADLAVAVRESRAQTDIGDLPEVLADPTQMRQLLQNLIGNALKFHRPGEAPRVVVEAEDAPDADHVAFRVSDDGIGIDPVYAERIFRVFERLHPRDVYAGTGIGLALCRKIAERHGGTVTVTSAEGAGTTFHVTLRRSPTDVAALPAASGRSADADREPVRA